MFWFREKFVKLSVFGHSAAGRPLYAVQVGEGQRRVLVAACHHANEWLTGLCLWGAAEDYVNGILQGRFAAVSGFAESTLMVVPWVNPDGAALLTGLGTAEEYASLSVPPERWKANLRGVDLNLNYPAEWQSVKDRKALLGVSAPGPRDWAGEKPLSEPETAALARLTRAFSPDAVVALHSQGEEIYANFGEECPHGTKRLAQSISDALGYPVIVTPPESDGGGYKDWFIREFSKPGITVEMGLGENPLPLSAYPILLQKTCRLLQCLTEWD